MNVFLRRRLLGLISVLFGVITIVFLIIHLVPGDPARIMLGEGALPSDVEALRESLGLNRPLIVQYFDFFAKLFQGDL